MATDRSAAFVFWSDPEKVSVNTDRPAFVMRRAFISLGSTNLETECVSYMISICV